MESRITIIPVVLYALLCKLFPWQWLGKLRKKGSMTSRDNPKIEHRSKKTRQVASCKDQAGTVFKVGDVVSLRRGAFRTNDPAPPLFLGQRVMKGKIEALFPDVKGLVLVLPRLGGYWSWDVNELKKVKP